MNKYYYLIKALRAHRRVEYGQFDKEYTYAVKETQDAANAIEELSLELDTAKQARDHLKRLLKWFEEYAANGIAPNCKEQVITSVSEFLRTTEDVK